MKYTDSTSLKLQLSKWCQRKAVLTSITFTLLGLMASHAVHAAPSQGAEFRSEARLELASEYYVERQYGRALNEVNQALSLNPQYVAALSMLGLIQMELQHPTEAESAFLTALKIDRNDGDTHNNYGWFLCLNKRTSEAFNQFDIAGKNPMYRTPEKAFYNAGKCAMTTNDKVSAKRYYNEALRAQPKATVVMYELAEIQFQEKNYTAVLDVLEQIDAIDGSNPKSLWLGLRSEYYLGHQNEVSSYAAQLLKRFPESAEALMYRAKSFE